MRVLRGRRPQGRPDLHEHGASGGTTALCRRHLISEQALDRWKRKDGGLQVNEAKRLRTLVWCTERRAGVIGFWLAFSAVITIVRQLVLEGWLRYCCGTRPQRRP